MRQFARQGGDVQAFKQEVERDIVTKLRQRCKQEHLYRQERIHKASYTWYGVRSVDEEALSTANRIPTPSCDELTDRHFSKF